MILNNAKSLYYKSKLISKVLYNGVVIWISKESLTAYEYDVLKMTANHYDSKMLTANQYDDYGKNLLP